MNEYFLIVNNKNKKVKLTNNSEIFVDETGYKVSLTHIGNNSYQLLVNNEVYEITARETGKRFEILIEGEYFETVVRTKLEMMADEYLGKKGKASHHDEIRAPMPGLILKIKKKIGDQVESGESIAVLEAMKMENNIKSSSTGIIKDILVTEGNSVEKNEIILIIE